MSTTILTPVRCIAILLLMASIAGCDTENAAPPVSPDLDIQSRQSNARTIVIFVHGVLGDAVTTFGTAENNWPKLIAEDPDIGRHADVSSIGYASTPISQASNINEIATRLSARLQDKNVFSKHDKVIFVVHSMGGLIVKRLLVQLRMDHPTDFKKVAGVIFLATPSGGSDLSQTATWISGNPQFKDMAPEDVNTLLQQMQDDWESLLRLRDEKLPYPKAFCVYETLPIGSIKIVPRSRAQMGCDERPVAFDRNHSSLVKPKSPSDEVYVYVAARIKRIIRDEYVQLSVNASLISPSDNVLSRYSVLKSGDQFAIRINTTKPAWVYVIGQDSTGKAERYFPSVFGGKQVAPARTIRVPSDSSLMLQLDNNKGVERIYVFATSHASEELEKLLSEVGGLATQKAEKKLDAAMSKRGALVASAKPSDKVAWPHKNFEAGSVGSEAADALVIEHR